MKTLNGLLKFVITAVIVPVTALTACTSTPDSTPTTTEPDRSILYGELEQESENYPAWSEKQQANSDLLAPEMSQSPYLSADKKYGTSRNKLRMSKASKRSSGKVASSRQYGEERSKKRKK